MRVQLNDFMLVFLVYLNCSDHTAMTKRFSTQRTAKPCGERGLGGGYSQALRPKGGEEEVGLLEAIKTHRDQVARHILLEKQFSNLELQDRRKDGTSLFWAAVGGLDDIVELLIWNGAQIDSRNKTGCTPLHAACDGNHPNIARMLLKWGAPIDTVTRNGDSCLHMACSRGNINIVKLLIEKTTKTTRLKNNSGKTPVQVAEANERWDIVEYLREHLNRTKNDVPDREGATIAQRTRNRDLSRKRSSRDLSQDCEKLEKVKFQHQVDRSTSVSPQRLPSLRPRGEGSSRRQSDKLNTGVKEPKHGGVRMRTRSRGQETSVKTTAAESPSGKEKRGASNLVPKASLKAKTSAVELTSCKERKGPSPLSSTTSTQESLDFVDSSIFRPYMNRSLSSSSRRASTPFRLQSMPYMGNAEPDMGNTELYTGNTGSYMGNRGTYMGNTGLYMGNTEPQELNDLNKD